MDTTHQLLKSLRTGRLSRRDFITRATALGISFSGIEMLLASCGSGGGNASKVNLTWSVWGNPGELTRFYQFTSDFNTHHPNISAQLAPIPTTNYEAKILTDLNGGVAPDIFYIMDDGTVTKLAQTGEIAELTSFFNGSLSQASPNDYYSGLWGGAKTSDGKIYAIPPDCNPLVLWYNKTVLQEAGVTEMPADLYTQGKWTRDIFTSMLRQVHAKGKYGYVLDDWDLVFYSWVTTNGGQVYSNNGQGTFVAHQNPQALDAFTWLASSVRAKLMIYASSLPRGQSNDVIFMANQAAFASAGRWFLPEFKQVKGLQYDIVPFPTPNGKIAPAGVGGAFVALNSKSKHMNEAFEFLTAFTSKVGQQFRLSGGGNALPSIKDDDQLVLDGNLPTHAQFFLDARNIGGYTLPPAEGRVPALATDIQSKLDPVWLQGADVEKTLNSVAQMVNSRIGQA